MWSPPMCTVCAGLRACRSNSRGALATCSSTKSGSSLTRLSPSTVWPACAEVLDRLRQHELDAELGDDAAPAPVEDVHRVLAEDLVPRHRVHEHGSPWLTRSTARVIYPSWNKSSNLRAAATPGTLAIDRAAQLLTLVLEAERPRGLGELAGDVELPKSTASRLLGALERQGLVEQRGRRGRFGPGPVLLRFAHRGIADRHLAELAQPHLNALSPRQRGDDQPRRAGRARRRAHRAGREPPLPRHRPVDRAPRALPLHRRRQGAGRLRRRRAARPRARAAHAGHDRRPRPARAASWPPSARRLRHGHRRARDRAGLARRAGARRRAATCSPRSRSPARRCAWTRCAWPSSPATDPRGPGARHARWENTTRECKPHDARRDPAAALRRDAGRQRPRGQGGRRSRASTTASSRSGCSTTR